MIETMHGLSQMDSPLGPLYLQSTERGISQLSFNKIPGETRNSEVLDLCMQQLDEYFRGKRKNFTIAFDVQGTEFQNRVWEVLKEIPFGKVMSYLDIAVKLGDSGAVRAVGMANGRNPVPILIPCHRVVGINGNLTGYSGGIEKKKFLLKHESANIFGQIELGL